MKMLRRLTMAATVAAVAALALAAPASAAPDWYESLHTCGVNYRCSITTNSTAGATHQINYVTTGSWTTSGLHSSSKAVPAGTSRAIASTPGNFSSKSSSCYCPGGASCPV